MRILSIRSLAVGITSLGGAVVASSCLAPGTLTDEDAYPLRPGARADSGIGSGGGSVFGGDSASLPPITSDAETMGCPQACAILVQRCGGLGCHASEGAAAGVDLASSGLVERLSGATVSTPACSGDTLLVAGSPEQSLVYTKLLDPPSCGLRMPLGAPLEDDEIECIRRWTESPTCESSSPSGSGGAASLPDSSTPPMGSGGSIQMGTGGSSIQDAAPMEVFQTLWHEAEASEITAPMAAFDDADASGGRYISVPAGPIKNDTPEATTDAFARFDFSVDAPGTYVVFGRIFATTEDDDSFWIRIDEGAWLQWNNLEHGAWTWNDVHDSQSAEGDVRVTFDLTAGQHSLTVMYREAGARLDKFAITNDAALMPMGLGQ